MKRILMLTIVLFVLISTTMSGTFTTFSDTEATVGNVICAWVDEPCEEESVCACEAIDWAQGVQLNGDPVQSIRSNPSNALGSPDATDQPSWQNFFSLGFGSDNPSTDPGWIIVKFCEPVGGQITVYECTPVISYGYPPETADVYVSQNGSDWTYVGVAQNNTSDTSVSHPSTFDLGTSCIEYVKIVDTTDKQPFIDRGNMGTADAFDVDAVCGEPCRNYNCTDQEMD